MAELLYNYYDKIFLQVQTADWNSVWFHLAIGMPQGCTASTIMFDVAFQLLLDIHAYLMTDVKKNGYTLTKTEIHISQPTYADDIALVAKNPQVTQKSIDAFSRALCWSKTMNPKPSKCKSLAFRKFMPKEKQVKFKARQKVQYSSFDPLLVVKYFDMKGKVLSKHPIGYIGDDDPPLFKYLGMKIQWDLRMENVVEEITNKLTKWLALVDGTLLTGPMKAWITNFHICSKLSWVLMIYNFSNSQAERWNDLTHSMYRKWMGLAKSAEASILYRSRVHFGLQFKHLREMQDQLQVTKWHIIKYSDDPNAKRLYEYKLKRDEKGHFGTGRKSTPRLKLEQSERNVTLDGMARGNTGVTGLGFLKSDKLPVTKKDKRKKLLSDLKRECEEKRLSILHTYEMQNNWMQYGLDTVHMAMTKDLTWNKILNKYSESFVKFVLNAQTNTLPSGDNLRRWDISKNVVCGLCNNVTVTLKHILAGCPYVREFENKQPSEDRYTWRHNCVLLELSRAILKKLRVVNNSPIDHSTKILGQPFVKAGGKRTSKPVKHKQKSILDDARDWKCNFDLPEVLLPGQKQLIFPQDVLVTSFRPDGYIISRQKKIIIIGPEMTCPMDENIAAWHLRKTTKYMKEFLDALKKIGWTVFDLSIEVGAQGWVPPSTFKLLRKLGFTSKETASITDNMRDLARKCSWVIFINRDNKNFAPWRICIDQSPMRSLSEGLLDHFDKKDVVSPKESEHYKLIDSIKNSNNIQLSVDEMDEKHTSDNEDKLNRVDFNYDTINQYDSGNNEHKNKTTSKINGGKPKKEIPITNLRRSERLKSQKNK